MDAIAIRVARPSDLDAILALHGRSIRALGAADYGADVIEMMLRQMPTMDPALIKDGTFLVAEDAAGEVVGSAGWTARVPNYAAILDRAPSPFPPAMDPVGTVRSVFVDPAVARRGLGRRLMERVEGAMRAAGFATAELMGTLPGERLYRALGYTALTPHAIRLPGGLQFRVRRMAKRLERTRADLPLAA